MLSGIFAGIIIGPVFLYAQSSPGSAGTPFDPAQPQAEPDPFAELGERYDPLGVFNTPQPPRNFVEQTPAERAEMEKEMEKGAAGAAARAAEENRKALAEKFTNRRTDYAMVTTNPADLANSATYDEYLSRMEGVLASLRRVLRDGRYATIIVRDAYQDGRYRFTGADLAARAEKVGFVTKGDLIWYQAGTRLRPYGYPRGFVPNIVHQHILVLRAG